MGIVYLFVLDCSKSANTLHWAYSKKPKIRCQKPFGHFTLKYFGYTFIITFVLRDYDDVTNFGISHEHILDINFVVVHY